jgi:hypothetical protein
MANAIFFRASWVKSTVSVKPATACTMLAPGAIAEASHVENAERSYRNNDDLANCEDQCWRRT